MTDVKKYGNEVLAIRADPEVIDDLYFILEKLLSLSRVLKRKSRAIQAEMNAHDQERAERKQRQFEDKALRIYGEFMKHQKAGLSRPEAIKLLVRDLGLQYYDAEIYISQGRRVVKRQRDRDIRDQAQDGQDLSEIAALHGLSLKTVQRVLEADTNPLTASR